MIAYSYQILLALGEDLSNADFMKEAVDASVCGKNLSSKEELVEEDGSEITSLALYAWCIRLLYH